MRERKGGVGWVLRGRRIEVREGWGAKHWWAGQGTRGRAKRARGAMLPQEQWWAGQAGQGAYMGAGKGTRGRATRAKGLWNRVMEPSDGTK